MTKKRQRDLNRRSVFRVNVAGAGIDVEINGLRGFSLIDITSEGLAAVTAHAPFSVDEVVSVKLCYQGREFSGHACVWNLRTARSGLYRYGLQILPDEDLLREGLRLVARSEQRRQLRRLADRR